MDKIVFPSKKKNWLKYLRKLKESLTKSIGTESSRSDIALDGVAEFEIQWEEIALGERVGLGLLS
ncbi:hypothetical protein E2562_033157 [Oryza meyeriana var. granulata]|uniref:Uncharacterized protein n=1 Tax=Oryza meyeriana var. granulata TaxID=110450 RepID=A0A6G1DRD8_9ORYZ|nr:hypothetical protein E2562_033157 [Oryza meyeriana var. granulata]